MCILDHVLFQTIPFSCRSQVTSDTSGNVGLHIYFSTEHSLIDLIEPAFSSLLLMQCCQPAARLLCNPAPITSPYFHYISTPRQANGVKKLGTWKQFNRPSMYEQVIWALWIPHSLPSPEPWEKVTFNLFSFSLFLLKKEECLYMWHHKKFETIIFSSPSSSLPAPTFAPLSPTSPLLLCWAP